MKEETIKKLEEIKKNMTKSKSSKSLNINLDDVIKHAKQKQAETWMK